MRDWNAAMDRIEAKLLEGVSGAELARIALTSEYHFRRMFASLAGMPLSEYVRRRRMTAATAEIVAGASVLEVAVKYGYGSAEAFSRPFKAMHGLTPSQARLPGAVLSSQPLLKFHLRVEGGTEVQYRLVDKESFRLLGFRTELPIVHRGRNEAIEQFERTIDRAAAERLKGISDVEPVGTVSATAYIDDDTSDGGRVEYWHAVATTAGPTEGFDSLEVPAGRWVVFTGEGALPEALQDLWSTAATEWFPANPYRWAPGPQLLRVEYDAGGSTGRGDLWIPIEPA